MFRWKLKHMCGYFKYLYLILQIPLIPLPNSKLSILDLVNDSNLTRPEFHPSLMINDLLFYPE